MLETPPGNRARERTRRTILLSAITTLVGRPNASLGEVADAAGVARSTLHRYFPDREALTAALDEFVLAEHRSALDRARPDEGTGLQAFTRIVGELLDASDVLAWWSRIDDGEVDDEADDEDDVRVAAVVARGQRDGSVDPSFDAQWLVHLIWSALWATELVTARGSLTRREARDTCLRSLVKLASAPPPAPAA
ncbi:TetR/AcrR family transcriptional regulator [Kineococcus sp. SYSU DK001]|uniref:TetR/AcrR family transcriptional regulator n=1 Tax=Kineococcus sp. SYSU DK001 TaxID=3383122 RepID=UPI003D7C3D3B